MNPESTGPIDEVSPLAAVEAVTATASLFAGLDADARAAVARELEWVSLKGGDALFRENEPGDALYVLISGRLRVFVSGEDGPRLVAEITRGEIVGEMAVLTDELRSATILAARDSMLVRFSRQAFERVVEQNPAALMRVTRRLINRLQQMNRGGTRTTKVATIAVVPLGDGAAAADVAVRLVRALSASGPTAHLRAGDVPVDEARTPEWLDDVERRHHCVVYEADARNDHWLERSLRQADRVLLVAAAEPALETDLLTAARRRLGLDTLQAPEELVLVHRASTVAPSGTGRWLAALGVAACHHVRAGRQEDVERLARFLTGRAVGLVLGGGGARGFAHIGVIRSLVEAGVPIDAIGGTSMGAVVAAQYASGHDVAGLLAINRAEWIDRNPLNDKTLPVVALLACRRIDRMMTSLYGTTQIEDLWLKYFCVSCDLTQAQAVVHDRGPLARAVRASMSLPGIAIPLHEGQSLLVDGGVLNNVPADVMKRLCRGPVVAVDVTPKKDLAVERPYPETGSGWSFLLNRKSMDLPSIGAVIMRTVMLSSAHQRKLVARDIDLLVAPPIDRYGMFDWHKLEEIADTGYQAAQPLVAEWVAAQPPLAK